MPRQLIQLAAAILLLSLPCSHAYCQTLEPDTLGLDTVTVEARGWARSVQIRSGDIKLDRTLMESLPRFAGESDYLRQLQWFPNITSANEYDTGIYVHGGESSHNNVLIAGAPIYQVGHMLGLFSAFSSTHYTSAHLSNAPSSGGHGNHLGATLEIEPENEVRHKLGGYVNVSPLATQGTLVCPISNSATVRLSGRATYLDLLYKQWLKNDGDQLSYNFYDINASFVCDKAYDTYQMDLYYSTDNCGVTSESTAYDLNTDWDNLLVSGRWTHEWRSGLSLKQTMFYSSFSNRLHFRYANASISTPSSISSWGYKAQVHSSVLDGGVEYMGHSLHPQTPLAVLSSGLIESQQSGHEFSAYIEKNFVRGRWRVLPAMRLSLFHNPIGHTECHVNPSLSVFYQASDWLSFRAGAYMRHQHLFRAGLSSIGMPIEFWFACDTIFHSQRAIGGNLNIDWLIARGDYALSVELYYKSLSNQCEYAGDLFGLWDKDYRWKERIAQGKGKNYGAGLILQKRNGNLTGWVSYSFNRSWRTFETSRLAGTYPSSHDRPHELNAVIAYHITPRWSVSSTCVIASGTPFTAPTSFYVINGSFVSQYGEYNANRLPAYRRVDLSASYEVKRKSFSYCFNCTLYNAFFLKNPIFYRLKIYDSKYSYRQMRFFTRMLPSVSFSLKF